LTLEAIIIRVDGAFAETEDLRRQAFIAAFREAGYPWDIDREAFAKSRAAGALRQRMSYFVRQNMKPRNEAPDIEHLIAAMHRRACKVFSEQIESGAVTPRAGMRELVVAARQEGVRLCLVSALARAEVERLLVQALGARGLESFSSITAVCERETPVAAEDLYRQAAAEIAAAPENCLVVEATLEGRAGAATAGLPAITTRSAYCLDAPGAGDSAGVFEDLPGVLVRSGKRRLEPLSADERADLLTALQRLHAAPEGTHPDSNGSEAMRVSDILKIKGPAVKTIAPGATMRALAQGLRAEAVGAMVVKDANGGVQGIISERDLARGLAEYGSDLPSMPVSALMTKAVITCAPEDSVAAVAKVMTQRRIRHLPVVAGGTLAGVISIGDVLKYRLDEVQLEANVLRDYAILRK
jgi:CBS domain-containing protein/beta-phosphoglucomutase-like phosphatase (HAD superfamily)